MSGIAGIYYVDRRPVDERVLKYMLSGIAHRGPDATGTWISEPVGLGHQMLWTTPESLPERQPLSNDDNTVCLTADARIDNRDEIRSNLLANGARLRSDTDAELILRSYEIWGENCAAKIIGDFAFAIWDSRLQRLFCARDPLGIKPFYYQFDGNEFRFASTPQSLFRDSARPPQPNLRVLSLLLLRRFEDLEETLYQDILRLPPAHCLVVERDRLRKERYWRIDPALVIRYRTDEEYADHFLTIFRSAVAARLRCHGPASVWLSGGLDSSSVICVAHDLERERNSQHVPLEAMSIVFDQMPYDERAYIHDVVQKCGVPASQFRHGDYATWLDFEQTDRYPDCPYAPTLLMLGPSLEHARQRHMHTVLTGIGGDDLMASSVVHLGDLFRQRRYADLHRQIRHDSNFMSRSRWSLFRDHCLKPNLPRRARAALRLMVRPLRRGPTSVCLSKKCHQLAMDGAPECVVHTTQFPTFAQQRICDRLERGWNTNVALGRVDAFASYFAIECRHPFFDRRLVEFMIAVPEEQRWFGALQKVLLRNAMTGILPESIRGRATKANFTPLVSREFRERQAGKVQSLMQKPVLAELGLIQIQEFHSLFERYRRGTVSNELRMECQNVIGLELWCRSTMRKL